MGSLPTAMRNGQANFPLSSFEEIIAMQFSLKAADDYIAKNHSGGNNVFKPLFHFSMPVGWINDPNGLIFYRGRYHVFCQYFPYGVEWGAMHWGHAVSRDLVKFEYMPVALAPDAPFESGCFSGGAVVHDDELCLLYTRHCDNGGKIRQTQCLAISHDGIQFEKVNEPVIEKPPCGISESDFRDPNPVRYGDAYYVVIGSRNSENKGIVLVYRSFDMRNFTYLFTIEHENFGGMVECPDLFFLDGKAVLVYSVLEQKKAEFDCGDGKSTMYAVMNIDFDKKSYNFENFGTLDSGTDFYAPQTLLDDSGRRVMLGWLDMWNNHRQPIENSHASNGVYTLPRMLRLKQGAVVQQPIKEVYDYFVCTREIAAGSSMEKSCLLRADVKSGSKLAFGHGGEVFTLSVQNGVLSVEIQFKNGKTIRSLQMIDERFGIEIFIDRCAVEVFACGKTMSFKVFIDGETYDIIAAENLSHATVSPFKNKEMDHE